MAKKLTAHEMYEKIMEVGIEKVILSDSELLYEEYMRDKEECNRGCNEEYEDKYTRAWSYIEECSGDDRTVLNDWYDSLEHMREC